MIEDSNPDCCRAGATAALAPAPPGGPSPERSRSLPGRGAAPRLDGTGSAGPLPSSRWDRVSAFLLVPMSFCLIGLTALLDYWTGPDLSLAIFYLLPIAAAAWCGGFAHGILMAVVSIVAWHIVDMAEAPALHPAVRLWNDLVRFCFFVITSSLLTRQRLAMRREQAMARTDPLTGAANGRTFYEVAQMELERSGRTGRPFTVAYLDVDNFKSVNDRLGHAAGDALLRRVAETIRTHTRASDLTARLGGDEFALLLPETDHRGALTMLARLRETLLREVAVADWQVTYSIGAATFLEPPHDVDAMVRRVDALMYVGKRGGKNRVHHEVVGDPQDAALERTPVGERRAEVHAIRERPVRIVCDTEALGHVCFATVRELTRQRIDLQLSTEIAQGTLVTVEPVCGGRARTLLARVSQTNPTSGGWFHRCDLTHHLSAEELRDWLA